jgi:ribosome-binding protein aMBF1 (putative translation factor)
MRRTKPFESKALQHTWDRYIGGDPAKRAAYDAALFKIEVAGLVHDLRSKAGLSQRELARKVGTTASVICRIEDADYEGHSLSLLKRVAAALGQRIEIHFVPARPPESKPGKAA